MIRKDLLKTVIVDFHKNNLPKYIKRELSVDLHSNKIISIVGPRRSGKTYFLYQIIDEFIGKNISKNRIVYINFEDERLDLRQDELDLIIQSYRELYPDIDINDVFFFFDEIQNISGWEKFVRRIYDSLSKNIFITGSNSKMLADEIATSLRGRTVKYEVLPLSFQEFLRFKGVEDLSDLDLYDSNVKAKMLYYFKEFMEWGSFPEILFYEEGTKIKVLQEYFDVMLYRDLIERYDIDEHFVLKFFIKRMAESVTRPLSVNNIFNELKSNGFKTGKDRLYHFIEYCENAYLIKRLKKYKQSILKTELAEKKIYFIDNGICRAVRYFRREDYGALFENIIFRENLRYGKEMYFYKEKKECDFVIEGTPVQVCFELIDETTTKREVAGILDYCKHYKRDFGIIITFESDDEIIEENCKIRIIPAFKWVFHRCDMNSFVY